MPAKHALWEVRLPSALSNPRGGVFNEWVQNNVTLDVWNVNPEGPLERFKVLTRLEWRSKI